MENDFLVFLLADVSAVDLHDNMANGFSFGFQEISHGDSSRDLTTESIDLDSQRHERCPLPGRLAWEKRV
jgi:hypothetical protein